MVETVDIELAAHHPVIEPVSNLSREREFPMQRLSDKIGPFGRCSQAETTPIRDFGAHVAPKLVWDSFGSWLRTIRPGIPPLEFVVANALRQTLPDFLMGPAKSDSLTKFIADRQDKGNMRIFRLAS